MREILFRGKLLSDGRWAEGNLDIKKSGVCIITPDKTPLGSYGQVDPETVGQYTGLTDSHGNRIFEGDIVEGEYFDDEDGYGIIQWNDGAFEIVNDYTCVTFHENLYGQDLEVIGNVHDNPELIGGAKDV